MFVNKFLSCRCDEEWHSTEKIVTSEMTTHRGQIMAECFCPASCPEEHLLQNLVSMGASSSWSCFNSVLFCPRFCISASMQADHAKTGYPKSLEEMIYPSVFVRKIHQLVDRKLQVECGLHFCLHFANYCSILQLNAWWNSRERRVLRPTHYEEWLERDPLK